MANRDKVITLRMNENSFNIIQDYAKSRGLSVNSYLNSLIDSYAEWYIPLSSYEPVAVPKRLFSSLFNVASKEKLDELAHSWAKEAKNGTVLLFGTEFNLDSALHYIRMLSKYVMGSHARITTDTSQGVDKTNKGNISIVVRHDLGENCSFYYSRRFLYFFNMLHSVKVSSVEYDESTIILKLDRKV